MQNWQVSSLAGLLALSIAIFLAPSSIAGEKPQVRSERVPDGGIQPQAAIDAQGTLHLIYFKGDPGQGDLYYVRRAAGKTDFSRPLRINSTDGSVVARGTIRGGQMALGKDGQIYAIWNASKQVPEFEHKLLFSRLKKGGGAFEPERNLLTNKTLEMDGGPTVAAGKKGDVYVFFHSAAKGQDDCKGRIYLSKSSDSGKTFTPNVPVDTPGIGACPCCSMKAHVDDSGIVSVLYRCAGENTGRDTVLLKSSDSGKTFSSKTMDSWQLKTCPMSMFSLSSAGSETAMVWESDKAIKFSKSDRDGIRTAASGSVKYPSVAVNETGESLVSWTEGSAWNKGGKACWQLYDKDSKAASTIESHDGVAAWSFTTALAQADGNFLVLY